MGARRMGVERWSGGGVGVGCQTAGSIAHALATLKMRRAHCSARTFTRATPRTRAHRAASADEVAAQAQLLVTTTPATVPLFSADVIRPGTHITAVGADTADKQELPAELLEESEGVRQDTTGHNFMR